MSGFMPPTSQVPPGPGANIFAITPDDDAILSPLTRYIYVDETGDVAVLGALNDTPVVFHAVPAGTMLWVCAQKVLATGTTSTSLIGIS